MKKSTRFYIILAISFIVSVFIIPSPKLNYKEMRAIDNWDEGKGSHNYHIEMKKLLQYKASGWGVFVLTAILTAIIYPLSSVLAGSNDSEQSLSELTGEVLEKEKVDREEIVGLSGEIVLFFKKELEKRFKNVMIYKIFFEIGEYWDENDKKCADFHLVIAPNDESNEAGFYLDENDSNCIRYPGFSPLVKLGIEYSDAVKIAKTVVDQIKLNFDFTGYNLSDDFNLFGLEEY